MTVLRLAGSPEHESAVRRLAGARAEQGRLRRLHPTVVGTRLGALAQARLSAARARVASREEWLHWIDEGESLAPRADGVWGPRVAGRF